ncbi:hypothetical protein GALMADRAFT_244647 [Galerina marginata CBS 339.88]|uniref:Protein FRA10AC1 n=1 Tax=Galerina marginata (strain CBS 339.88) TaxID=685588 RepID=A0A067TJ52_GALM3|nr:hypothetical protein GALMADRAFT_244647 [Galerina marginata CBS 339.88]
MALYKYASSSRQTASTPVGITEFEILKASHKFLREDDEKPSTWEGQLAEKYYSNLYREFAVCDLKHYKSGNFALRWRTEEEVLDGSGESTCGNTRCEHHFPQRFAQEDKPVLTTLELPFAYLEHGERKSALVKVVLCGKCVKKLMWKHSKEKGKEKENPVLMQDPQSADQAVSTTIHKVDDEDEDHLESHRRKRRSRGDTEEKEKERPSRRRRRSFSNSPQRPDLNNEEGHPKERPYTKPEA